ncbi:MAG: dolichyl-phosphate beta-glucosyltransferase [Planctomycetota bacterium]
MTSAQSVPEGGAARPVQRPAQLPALSLVIPAYDEGARLERTFAGIRAWRRDPPCRPLELVLVDDGSADDTLARMRAFSAEEARDPESCACVVLAEPHRGKGAAVRSGMLAARGDLVLFSDADLSAPLEEARHLVQAVLEGADVAIGSRELPGSSREEEPLYRHVLGRGFNWLVQAALVPGVRDTQCGFKLFRREAAWAIFAKLRRYGADAPTVQGPMVTAFDVEVLYLARRLGLRVAEVPVHWVHAPQSKVQPGRDALRMARDVALVRWGAWRGDYDV